MPHDNGVHDKEPSPWQPQSVLLGDEWSALKVQGYGYAPVGHQVETGKTDANNVREDELIPILSFILSLL